MAGRDVRRLVARATSLTPRKPARQVARAAIGAAAAGAERIFVCAEPFRISASAVENLDISAENHVLDIGAQLDSGDTARAAEAMREAGCGAVVVLARDGTNRSIAKAWPDARLVPISTGTNNVFPVSMEATLAGAASGLVASGRIRSGGSSADARRSYGSRSRRSRNDLALIDAVFLVGDRVGNLLPFDTAQDRSDRSGARGNRPRRDLADRWPVGTLWFCGRVRRRRALRARPSRPRESAAPIGCQSHPAYTAPCMSRTAAGSNSGSGVEVRGPGVLAFDGDREHTLADGQRASLTVLREGPLILDVPHALRVAAGARPLLGSWRLARRAGRGSGSRLLLEERPERQFAFGRTGGPPVSLSSPIINSDRI